jgi:hypothetical protein
LEDEIPGEAQPFPELGVYADAIYLHIGTDKVGSADIGRFAVGVEYGPSVRWSLRSGVSISTDGHVNASAGFGFAPREGIDVQFAWQSNTAPEVNHELGRTPLLVVSVAVRLW